MPQKETIRNLAEIQIGYQLREKPKADEAGEIRLIQLKDINASRTHLALSEETVLFDPERSIEKQLLKEGDVLFMGKGSKPFACPVHGLPSPAVATGMFFILRPDTKRVLPEYLAWALNREDNLRKLLVSSGTGVAMPVIRRSVLEEFSIPLPPMETQKIIGELLRLSDEEQELMIELAEQKKTLMQAVCRKLMGKF
jgi:restriction endonuclease S subunit